MSTRDTPEGAARMSETKPAFSEGPWRTVSGSPRIHAANERHICSVMWQGKSDFPGVWVQSEEDGANARLIAAAPDLYWALKALVNDHEACVAEDARCPALAAARAALALLRDPRQDVGVSPASQGSGHTPNLASLASASVPHAASPTTEAEDQAADALMRWCEGNDLEGEVSASDLESIWRAAWKWSRDYAAEGK